MHSEQIIAPSAPPRYIEEVEALLQTPFFSDEERSDSLYYNFSALQPEDIAAKALAYIQGLRILAKARSQDREVYQDTRSILNVKTWNARWVGGLIMKRIANINQTYQEEIAKAVQCLEIVNENDSSDVREVANESKRPSDVKKLANESELGDAKKDELSPLQRLYVDDALQLLEQKPKKVKRPIQGKTETFYVQGVNIVGPTGFGKTAINGALAKELGIGKPHETEPHRRKRMLIVVPSQQLVEQYAGITGDKTFIRFAKGVSVTHYYGAGKSLGGDAIVTTTNQFIEGFYDNHFFDVPIDVLGFDEVHHLTAPLVEETFLFEWNGPTLGFTATTDYNKEKDSRLILPYTVEHIDLLDSIEHGATNGAQLFTILVDCKNLKTDNLTPKQVRALYREHRDEVIVEFLKPLMALGRRAMVFCDQGQQAKGAVNMANRLSEIVLPGSGKRIKAEPITSYQPATGNKSNRSKLQRYHNGEIDALTTVETGIESLNADIDIVVLNAIYSSLKLRQLIGRGTRPSKRFPVTVYAQLILPFYAGARAPRIPYTIYEGFGLERIEQGKVIRAKNDIKKSTHSNTRQDPSGVDFSIFTPELQVLMQDINYKTISEVLLDSDATKEITEGFIRFDDIPRPANTSAQAARYRLDAAGFTWEGRYERGSLGIVRYYEPGARDYFIKNPLAERASDNVISIGDLADKYQVVYRTMRKALKDAGIPTIDLMGKGNTGAHVDKRLFSQLDEYMEEEMPLRQPGDISTAELAKETKTTTAFLHLLSRNNNIKAKYRRDPKEKDDPDGKPTERTWQLLSKADADKLRELFYAHPRAEPTDVIKGDVRRALGISDTARFDRNLTEEEKAWLTPKWTKDASGKLKLLDNLTKEQAETIKTRMRAELNHELPAHLLPCSVTDNLFTVQPATVVRKVKDLQASNETVPLGFSDRKHKCIPWSTLQRLERYFFERRPGAIKIDYEKLPTGPDDNDPERIAYARSIQAKLVPKLLLGFEPEAQE